MTGNVTVWNRRSSSQSGQVLGLVLDSYGPSFEILDLFTSRFNRSTSLDIIWVGPSPEAQPLEVLQPGYSVCH